MQNISIMAYMSHSFITQLLLLRMGAVGRGGGGGGAPCMLSCRILKSVMSPSRRLNCHVQCRMSLSPENV